MPSIQLLFAMPVGSEWLFVAMGLLLIVFWIKMIIEIATSEFRDSTSKVLWLLITVVLGVLGAFVYYFAGRNARMEQSA